MTRNGKVNSWVEEAFKKLEQRRKVVKGIHAVIEVEHGKAEEVASTIRQLGYTFEGIVDDFVFVDLPEPADFEKVARLPYVKTVSTQKLLWPAAIGIDDIFKTIIIAEDPILSKLTRSDLKDLGIETRPAAEIPKPMQAILRNIKELRQLTTDPLSLATRLVKSIPRSFPFPPVLTSTSEAWKLVSDTKKLMGAPPIEEAMISANTLCGSVDSGISPHPALQKVYEYHNLAIDFSPFDNMGHGMHVTTTAFGNRTPFCRYGVFEPVADAKKLLHVKVFGAFGPCTSFQIMTAMELCAKRGVKVVNMSLGSCLMGSVEEDPECVLLRKLYDKYGTNFIIATGNDAKEWSVNSPGASPFALTVAAIDWHTLDTAEFSSRGPQGAFYQKNRSLYEDHLYKYGDNFRKPDCGGIGTDVVAGCLGWYDLLGVTDFIGDGYEMMSGSSQATPHVAGLVALAIDKGFVNNIDDAKARMKKISPEKTRDQGYGLLKWDMLSSSFS